MVGSREHEETFSPRCFAVIPSLDLYGAFGQQVTDDDGTVMLTIFAGPAACVHAEVTKENRS